MDEKQGIEMLRGIAVGIAIDYKITDGEIRGIENWLLNHASLKWRYPFRELDQLISRARADGLDDDVREEICDWCWQLMDKGGIRCQCETEAIQRLQGVLQGISMDGIVSHQEMVDLRDWLFDYEAFKACWPFSSVHELVDRVLADNHIDDIEHKEILSFCDQFSDQEPVFHKTHSKAWRKSLHPGALDIDHICEPNPAVRFVGKSFCFTGTFEVAERKELILAIETLGGNSRPNVSPKLDYLVIGDLAAPQWVYSTYGRKVESVVQNWAGGSKTLIIREKDFVTSAKSVKEDVFHSIIWKFLD